MSVVFSEEEGYDFIDLLDCFICTGIGFSDDDDDDDVVAVDDDEIWSFVFHSCFILSSFFSPLQNSEHSGNGWYPLALHYHRHPHHDLV